MSDRTANTQVHSHMTRSFSGLKEQYVNRLEGIFRVTWPCVATFLFEGSSKKGKISGFNPWDVPWGVFIFLQNEGCIPKSTAWFQKKEDRTDWLDVHGQRRASIWETRPATRPCSCKNTKSRSRPASRITSNAVALGQATCINMVQVYASFQNLCQTFRATTAITLGAFTVRTRHLLDDPGS